jgi:hypothetical protein
MLDRILNWLFGIDWSGIRTDDRQVRRFIRPQSIELRRKLQGVGLYRQRQYEPIWQQPERPFGPTDDDIPADRSALHINPQLRGWRLGMVGEKFRVDIAAKAARSRLDEMVERIEAAADAMYRELCADIGVLP